jgi:thymidylate synthase
MFYVNLETVLKLNKIVVGKNFFVIGGSEIYDTFFINYSNLIKNVYFTEIKGYKASIQGEPDVFINNFNSNFKLVSFSEQFIESKQNVQDHDPIEIKYRILKYIQTPAGMGGLAEENVYLDLMRDILLNGKEREDRTGTGTISLFGKSMRFDISKNLPMITTKFVPFKTIVEELLWFCRGDTDNKILQKKGVKIWNGNSSREFLDSRNLDYPEGIVGPMYGWQIRHFNCKYKPEFADTSKFKSGELTGFDQLSYVENLLKTDPFSRRIVMSYWNPTQLDQMALAPCHILVQFYVEEINGEKYLSCQFYQRSSDSLAFCFNVVSYSILTYILAEKCCMKPKDIIYTAGDVHIYKNHIEGVETQLLRSYNPSPILKINPELKNKDWSEMCFEDFELIGYFPQPTIKMDMAI